MMSTDARIAIAEHYLKAAEEVAKQMHNPQVDAVVDFLGSVSSMIYPETDCDFHRGQPLRCNFRGKQNGHWLWIYIFDQGDLPYLPPQLFKFMDISCSTKVAGYWHANRFLRLRSDGVQLSSFSKAVLLLHEGCHAFLQQVNNEVGNTPLHEFNVCSFDHNWVSEFGGPAYEELLKRTIALHRTQLMAHLVSCDQVCELDYPNELEEIFGASSGEFDRALRYNQLHRHATFTILQNDGLSLRDQVEKLRPLIC